MNNGKVYLNNLKELAEFINYLSTDYTFAAYKTDFGSWVIEIFVKS